ncbi:hypothetical protein Q4534_22450 [Cyclobacterium sp. 1_MG-2023]|uniref:hypothetical protein n=1 Tax=Cyclobacterium sp. 1_MG-2023 TaxID=3062681 RepID=UPI0026E484D5|nr:hypothetical protein [Cyclobacterium sp. 1_MG-2023]MDO6440206.1 hypothetical protein [Cyclobacterium sp. 1_MG-2023]
MKTKNILSISFIVSLILMMGCTEQPYFDIPYDENGNVIFTDISEVTSDGVTAADPDFTINAIFPNAKPGDVMEAEVLKNQVPSWDPEGALQLLPLEGSLKEVTVGDDLTASVTYTKEEAGLTNVGDAVTIVFSGDTDSGIISITLEP